MSTRAREGEGGHGTRMPGGTRGNALSRTPKEENPLALSSARRHRHPAIHRRLGHTEGGGTSSFLLTVPMKARRMTKVHARPKGSEERKE